MVNNNWTTEQLILALSLYFKLGFSNIKYSHPKVIELSKVLGRTPSAIAYKLVNFARLDPELQKRGVKGMSHGSKSEKPVWDEFYEDIDRLAEVSEEILARLRNKSLEESSGIDLTNLPKGKERKRLVRLRVNQNFFREMILSLYKNKCCITGIDNPELLVAGHISEWSVDKKNRMNPKNGICLNLLHDKAFEKGLIGISPDYRIHISSTLKNQKKSWVTIDYFIRYEHKLINLPTIYRPDQAFLERHFRERFIK